MAILTWQNVSAPAGSGAGDMISTANNAFAAAMDAGADPGRRPVAQDRRDRLSALAARYRHWKRRRFPKRS